MTVRYWRLVLEGSPSIDTVIGTVIPDGGELRRFHPEGRVTRVYFSAERGSAATEPSMAPGSAVQPEEVGIDEVLDLR